PPIRVTSGRRSRPAASSFGRIRVLMASMRGLKPGMSNTLKSDVLKPGNMLVLLRLDGGVPIEQECRHGRRAVGHGNVVSRSSGKIGRRIRSKRKRVRLDEERPGASTSMISFAIGSNAAR